MIQRCEKLRIDLRDTDETQVREVVAVLYWLATVMAETGFCLQVTPLPRPEPTPSPTRQ